MPQHTDEPIQSEHPDADNAVNPMPREARALAAFDRVEPRPGAGQIYWRGATPRFEPQRSAPGRRRATLCWSSMEVMSSMLLAVVRSGEAEQRRAARCSLGCTASRASRPICWEVMTLQRRPRV